MFEKLNKIISRLEEICADDAYFETSSVCFEELACAEAFASVVTRQHAEWCARNEKECAIEALENKLMGYTR